MVVTKKINALKWLIFVYFVIFPFGQLARIEIILGTYKIPILAIDLIVGLIALFFVTRKTKKPKIWLYMLSFIMLSTFSLVISFFLFNTSLVAILYLLRLLANFVFFVMVYDLSEKSHFQELIFKSLLAVVFFIALFGWIQYLIYPDLRFLYVFGWDDHLHRLVGTFLDPGFTSILLVFGFLASLSSFLFKKDKRYLVLCTFLFITILFTYSRAGYLALFAGTAFLLRKSISKIALVVVIIAISLLLLPRTEGEGVKLERIASIDKRLVNYSQTFEIFKKSPVFGFGYNNLCTAKRYFYRGAFFGEHSCSGSDASYLLLLATTGVLGFSIFLQILNKFTKVRRNIYGNAFLSCGTALLVHSLFVNGLFYPWVIGWILVLAAVSVKE